LAGTLSEVRELDAAAAEARSVLRRLERLRSRLQEGQNPVLLQQAESVLEGGQQLLALIETERAQARQQLRGVLRGGAD
jgi:hypothetical protein